MYSRSLSEQYRKKLVNVTNKIRLDAAKPFLKKIANKTAETTGDLKKKRK